MKIWRPREDALDPKTAYDFRDNRKTPEGEQVIKNLDCIFHKIGRSITSVEFVFSPFKDDLPNNNHIKNNSQKTKPGTESPCLQEAKRVLEYFSYLSMLRFEEKLLDFFHISLIFITFNLI